VRRLYFADFRIDVHRSQRRHENSFRKIDCHPLACLALFIQMPDKLNDFADIFWRHHEVAGSKNNFETGNKKATMRTPPRLSPVSSFEPVIDYPLLPPSVVFREFSHLKTSALSDCSVSRRYERFWWS